MEATAREKQGNQKWEKDGTTLSRMEVSYILILRFSMLSWLFKSMQNAIRSLYDCLSPRCACKTCTVQRRICPTEAERSPNSVSSCSLKQPGKNKNKTMDEPVHSQRQISRVHTAALPTKHSWGLIATQDVFERKDKDININAKIAIRCCCPDNQWLIWWLYSVSKAVVAIGGASQDAHPGVRHSCSPSVWLTAWWTEPGAAISLFYSQRTQTPNLKDGEEETREAEMFSPATPRTRPTRCFASCISKELRVDSC